MDIISAADFNTYFTRLENVRQKQYNRADLSSTVRSSIRTAYQTNIAVKDNITKRSAVQQIQTDLDNLRNVPSISSSFTSSLTIPSVGELMKASKITLIETNVRAVENICANCAFFTNSAREGDFSNDGFFTSAASNGNFSDCGSNFTTRGNENNYSNFSGAARCSNDGKFSSATNNGNFASGTRSNF